jgi:hypothetical protein
VKKKLCSVPVGGDDEENSHSLVESTMPLLLRREDNGSEDDPAAYHDDTLGQDMTLVVNDSSNELLDYLCQVTIEKASGNQTSISGQIQLKPSSTRFK